MRQEQNAVLTLLLTFSDIFVSIHKLWSAELVEEVNGLSRSHPLLNHALLTIINNIK